MRQRMVVEFLVILAAVLVSTQSISAHESRFEQCILQQSPFAPTDVRLFTPQVYAEAPPLVPASPYAVSEERLRNLVRRTLNERFHGNRRKVAQGLAVFDSDEIAEIVPDPRLRAGFALLLGTVGESAIDAIKAGVFVSVEFADLPPIGAARSVTDPATGKQKIQFSITYQYEDPAC